MVIVGVVGQTMRTTAGHAVGFDELDLQVVVIDLAGCQWGGGMIGQGGTSHSVQAPVSVVVQRPGPTYVVSTRRAPGSILRVACSDEAKSASG